jgi:hypothetical protein
MNNSKSINPKLRLRQAVNTSVVPFQRYWKLPTPSLDSLPLTKKEVFATNKI